MSFYAAIIRNFDLIKLLVRAVSQESFSTAIIQHVVEIRQEIPDKFREISYCI